MMKSKVGAYFTGCCVLAVMGGATAASAQAIVGAQSSQSQAAVDPAAEKPVVAQKAGDTPTAVTEVIVTAQRRAGSLERTPVAVSVLSSTALGNRAITTEADLQSAVPGLTVRASQNSNQLNYAIRGQSLDAFSGTRPGVLPYVDEIQVGGGGGASAFYDLQSIQVLKGPQGTLFGRNSTGGAVLFTTAKPVDDVEGYILGRLGDYNLRYVEGAINVPVVHDKVLLRLAGTYEHRDGFQKDIFQNDRAGNVDRYGIRPSLTIKPTDWIRNDLVVDYYHAGGNSLEGPIYSLNPNGAVPLIALTNFGNAAQFDQIISGFVAGAGGPPNAGAGAGAAYAAANPRLDPGGLASYLATQRSRGPFIVESNSPNQYRGENTIISNVTSVDIATGVQLRNVLGYTRIDSSNKGDIDGTPYGIDDNGDIINKTKQFSEELQLIGKAFERRLSYVAGAFYSPESSIYINTGKILSFPIIASSQSYAAKTTNDTYAAYAQGTYDLDQLTGIRGLAVTAGARYTDEKVGLQTLPADISFRDPAAAQAKYKPNQSKTYNNVSWTLGAQDQVNTNLLLYVASRRSYRNGGFNTSERPAPGLGTQGGDAYATETVTDLELGSKYQGIAAGVPVRANIALYRDWINNSQRVAYTIIGGSPAAVTVNVPEASVQGVEFDGSISPTRWLELGAAINYTDAKFTKNLVSISGGAPVVFGTYPDTPEYSGSAFAAMTVPISEALAVTFRSDVYAQSSVYFTSTGNTNPTAKLPSYTLVNLRISLENKRGGWSLAASLKNAFNEVYYVGGVGLGELFQFNTAVPGDPRTFFIEARHSF